MRQTRKRSSSVRSASYRPDSLGAVAQGDAPLARHDRQPAKAAAPYGTRRLADRADLRRVVAVVAARPSSETAVPSRRRRAVRLLE